MPKNEKKKELIEKMVKDLNLNKKKVVRPTVCIPEYPISSK